MDTITLNVDASFKDGYGAVAYYIKHRKFVAKGTKFLGKVANNNEAEYLGIIIGLYALDYERRDRVINKIYINCDNINALLKLENNIEDIPLNLRKAIIVPLHVKGHSYKRNNMPRNWVNEWCDVNARTCREENIEALASGQKP